MPCTGQTLSNNLGVQLRGRLRQGLLRGRLSSPFCSMWLWSRFFGELLFWNEKRIFNIIAYFSTINSNLKVPTRLLYLFSKDTSISEQTKQANVVANDDWLMQSTQGAYRFSKHIDQQ